MRNLPFALLFLGNGLSLKERIRRMKSCIAYLFIGLCIACVNVSAAPGERWIFVVDSLGGFVKEPAGVIPDYRKLTAAAVPQTVNVVIQNLSAPGGTMATVPSLAGWDAYSNRAILKNLDGYFGAKGVIIMLGTNDWNTAAITTTQFHDQYLEYVQYAKAQGLEVVCIGPLWRSDQDQKKTHGSSTYQLWVFRWIIQSVCNDEGVPYIDGSLAPLLPQHFPDGLHMNGAGHQVFTEWLIQQMQALGYWTDTY